MQNLYKNRQTFSKYVNDIHNQMKFHHDNQWKMIEGLINPHDLLIVKLLNLNLNESLSKLKQSKNQSFESLKYRISNQVMNIGYIARYLAGFCNFSDSKEYQLAQFQTIEFLKLIQNQRSNFLDFLKKNQKLYFLDFLKGIYPRINVHKSNLPLYMPLYQSIQNYFNMGNPNWEMSRIGLDSVYREEILGSPEVEKDGWYLILQNDKKILEKYNSSVLEKLWAHFYFLYVQSTLKPYRIFTVQEQDFSEHVFLNNIKSLMEQALAGYEIPEETKLVIALVLNLLSGENYGFFNRVFEQFSVKFQYLLSHYESQSNNNEEFRVQLTVYGLINCQINQLNRNYRQLCLLKDENVETNLNILNRIDELSNKFNLRLLKERVMFSDYYLRIFYPGRLSNQDSLMENQRESASSSDQKIYQIFEQLMRSGSQDSPYPFFIYPYYSPQLYQRLGQLYIDHYPNEIIHVLAYLQKNQLIWRLLITTALNDESSFMKIKQNLKQNEFQYIKIITSEIKDAGKVQYDKFINLWDSYYDFLRNTSMNNPLINVDYTNRITNCIGFLEDFREQGKLLQSIKSRARTPFSFNQNRVKVLRIFMNFVDSFYSNIQLSDNPQLSARTGDACLQLLKKNWLKQQFVDILEQDQKDEFWKVMSCVYLNDESLMNRLIRGNVSEVEEDDKNDQVRVDQQQQLIVVQERRDYQVMELQ